MALIVIFLCLPKPWSLAWPQPIRAIELELLKSPATPAVKTNNETQTIAPPPVKPVFQPPNEAAINKGAKEVVQQQTEPKPQASVTVEPTTTPQLNAGTVLQMMQNRTSVDIPAEFQASTGAATDFYIPEQEIHDWLADIPFLDESVDKPKLQMRFYAEGLDGSIEKFFDKITISKTFTTKYGTKVHCALIGIIAACSWK